MNTLILLLVAFLPDPPPEPGKHTIRLTVDDRPRSYLMHIPTSYDAAQPTPVVLAFHGTSMNPKTMAAFSGLSDKAEEAGFIVVYPKGTGPNEVRLEFNAGDSPVQPEDNRPDDVKFTASLLDDLATRVNVDPKRVFATGMSNGGSMCYRLAALLPERFAAIAPVSGTMPVDVSRPTRPMPILHFHGTDDPVVRYGGPDTESAEFDRVLSVDDTVRLWVDVNKCPLDSVVVDLPDRVDDGTTVKQSTWGPGREKAEVILYAIEGGGHTWPGYDTMLKKLLGRSTHDISANDLIWEFFLRHPQP
ncbi:MAG: polyhydroxybutyrate depolymerase [Planctomycetaceae bacterium]|nr:polyhydroxybutyrate depolymerase [Planctomycetaceae bacterium]